MTPTLLVGSRGLLGREVGRALGPDVLTAEIRWGQAGQDGDLEAAVAALADEPGATRDGWRIVWCAGRSVISSDPITARAETSALAILMASAARLLPPGPAGRIVLASSAGAIHAGSPGPPFDEMTPPAPRSAYGTEKLAQEALIAAAARTTGLDAVAVRMGPVYGPGQDPDKAQGLVTGLCSASIHRRPLRVFVPLDTRRSYLWSGDAGRILARIATRPPGPGGGLRIRTIAGPSMVSIRQLIETVARVTRRRPPVLIAPGPEAAAHAPDLQLVSRHPADTTLVDPTPLTVGIGNLWRELLAVPALPAP